MEIGVTSRSASIHSMVATVIQLLLLLMNGLTIRIGWQCFLPSCGAHKHWLPFGLNGSTNPTHSALETLIVSMCKFLCLSISYDDLLAASYFQSPNRTKRKRNTMQDNLIVCSIKLGHGTASVSTLSPLISVPIISQHVWPSSISTYSQTCFADHARTLIINEPDLCTHPC